MYNIYIIHIYIPYKSKYSNGLSELNKHTATFDQCQNPRDLLYIEDYTTQSAGMPAQVSKFGENKPFTNRNVCLGSRNKPLAAHETFVSRVKTNLFRGQMAIQWLRKVSSSFCAKQSAGKLNFGHGKVCFRQES